MCHFNRIHLRLHKLGLDFDDFLEILGLAKFVHVLINLAMKRKLSSTEDDLARFSYIETDNFNVLTYYPPMPSEHPTERSRTVGQSAMV